MIFVPRSQWGWTGLPTSTSGAPRPRLSKLRILTVHYTGVSAELNGRPRYPADLDMAAFMNQLETTARNAGKPFEYNYCIPPRAEAEVWEYAGMHQAAHSAGNNDIAVGVLLVVGVGQPPTAGQAEAVRWLRDIYLVGCDVLVSGAATIPHRHMANAATACPGDAVLAKWDQFTAPYHLPEPTPAPHAENSEDDMSTPDPKLIRFAGTANELLFAANTFTHGTEDQIGDWREKYGEDGKRAHKWEAHPLAMKGAFRKAGLDYPGDVVYLDDETA